MENSGRERAGPLDQLRQRLAIVIHVAARCPGLVAAREPATAPVEDRDRCADRLFDRCRKLFQLAGRDQAG